MRRSMPVWIAFGVFVAAIEVSAADNRPVLYRLTAGSGYEWGCLGGPCDCPAYGPVPAIGTFRLQLQQVGPLFTDYLLTDIVWYVNLPDGRIRLTGSGAYHVGGEVAVTQQLQLTLSYPDGKVRQFDSGLVPGGGRFPLIDVQTYVTGVDCIDAGIHVTAEPAPYTVYRLGKQSALTQGCFDGICECAVEGPFPLAGTFLLTPIDTNPLFNTYALTNVRWATSVGGKTFLIRGDGLYQIGGEVAITQHIELDLTFDDETTVEHLDSNTLPPASGFPAIDITASTHTLCYNRRIDLQARPVGDFDLNASVDAIDLDGFNACFTGPAIEQPAWDCQAADIDGDGDVDQDDFGLLQRCLTAPGIPMDPNCAG